MSISTLKMFIVIPSKSPGISHLVFIPYMRENSAPVVNSAPDNNWLNKIGFFLLLQ